MSAYYYGKKHYAKAITITKYKTNWWPIYTAAAKESSIHVESIITSSGQSFPASRPWGWTGSRGHPQKTRGQAARIMKRNHSKSTSTSYLQLLVQQEVHRAMDFGILGPGKMYASFRYLYQLPAGPISTSLFVSLISRPFLLPVFDCLQWRGEARDLVTCNNVRCTDGRHTGGGAQPL